MEKYKYLGFTLVEVLLSVTIMAVMGAMSWLGIDALISSKERTTEQSNENARMQIMLSQWTRDLELAIIFPGIEQMSWDNEVFRLTRYDPFEKGLVVVAWAIQNSSEDSYLMRWQSPAFTTLNLWRSAWETALNWGHGGIGSSKNNQVSTLIPASQMDIFVLNGKNYQKPNYNNKPPNNDEDEEKKKPQIIMNPDGINLRLITPAGDLIKDWLNPTFMVDD